MNVTLNGSVIPEEDQWLYDWFEVPAFNPSKVRNAIEANPAGETLVLEINSSGGSVFAGFEIYSVLREASCETEAHVQSLAASAASTLMLGCDRTLMSPVAQVMIHPPADGGGGNVHDHEQSIKVLESITESILNGYELRCHGKATREELAQMVDAETWLTAQRAVELGLADGILYADSAESSVLAAANVVNAIGGGIRAVANSAVPMSAVDMRARYEQLVREGAKPADGHPVLGAGEKPDPKDQTPAPGNEPEPVCDDWQRKARLAIENNRFL